MLPGYQAQMLLERVPPSAGDCCSPSILYFGTPVALVSTENENGSFNLAPMSSAWALGQVIVLGLGAEGQTAQCSLADARGPAGPAEDSREREFYLLGQGRRTGHVGISIRSDKIAVFAVGH